jgi:murein endopeptidase
VIALLTVALVALGVADQMLPRAGGASGVSHRAHPARELPASEVARLRGLEAGIDWRRSTAAGLPYRGKLVDGVQLPEEGFHFFSWDGRDGHRPNPPERRWGTGGLVRTILEVCAGFVEANPDAARCAVGDLSREHGGPFGRRYGGDGHSSHQNGLDVDVYYPRADGAELAPASAEQIDRRLAQDLVDRFVAAGADKIFVGPATHLHGPKDVVQTLRNHDDHMHVRLRAGLAGRDGLP